MTHWSHQVVPEHVVGKEREREVEFGSNIWFQSSARSKRCLTDTPWKQRQLRSNQFVSKQNQSLELLSLFYRCPAGSANKHCICSIAGVLWGKKENRKVNNQTFSLSRETNICKWNEKETAQFGNWVKSNCKRWKWELGRNLVYSIKFTKGSCWDFI